MSVTALVVDTSYLLELLKVYDLSELLRLCDVYAQQLAVQGIGLSDTALIEEARRLKTKYNQPEDRVHIWTRDRRLKTHEPDAEPEPL